MGTPTKSRPPVTSNIIVTLITFAVTVSTLALLTTPKPELAVIPSLGIIFMMLLGNRPALGYYIIIWFIPFGAYRGLSGPLSFIKVHWVIAFCLITFVVFKSISQKRLPSDLRCSLWGPLALLTAISAIAAAMSPFSEYAWKNVFLFIVAALYIGLTLLHVSQRGYIRTLPQVIIWSVTVSSLFAVLGFFFNVELFAEKVDSGFKRGLGAAPDPNNMALMIIFSMPFLAHWSFHTKKLMAKLLIPCILGINVLGMVTTYSRGGALIMMLTVLAIAMQHRKKISPRHIGLLLAGMCLAAVTTLALVPPSYWARQKSLVAADDLSLKRRASYLIVAWDAFRQRPLRGWGPGAFKFLYAESEMAHKYVRPGKSKLRPAHNTYLEIVIGTGLIGLAVYALIIVRSAKSFLTARRIFRDKGDTAAYEITGAYQVALGALLVFLLLFSDEYHKHLLLTLAVSQVALRLAQDQTNEELS